MNRASVTGKEAGSLTMPDVTPIVYVVDDDLSLREALEGLIREAGWRPLVFATAREFLSHTHVPCPSCAVLDVALPDLNGLDLQRRIVAEHAYIPIIVITGYGDVPMTVRAMKAGAVEFLTKPFTDEALMDAIRGALERSANTLDQMAEVQSLHERYTSLSGREREVMALVVRGLMNKQVGGELGISEITVKAHRGRMMQKMGASSLAGLVTIAAKLGIPTSGGR